MHKLLFTVVLASLFIACSSTNINIADYSKNINQKLQIDPICKSLYTNSKPRVAVVPFTNNTNKKITNQLSNSFISQIEQMVLNTKGAKLFTRSDLNKVNDELKLQDSGLLDPNSIVQFGLNSGVQYIITGSIDYISHNFSNYSSYTGTLAHTSLYTNNSKLQLASAAVFLASSFFDGTKVKSAVTVKIIDVATGQIIFSKQVKTSKKIHSNNKPSYSQVVGIVKNSINEALPSLQNNLKKQFEKIAYINKIKKIPAKNNIAVQINIGKDNDIKEGDEFIIQNLEVFEDPLTNTKTCEKINTNIKLIATQKISNTHTWLKVIDGNISNIKLLQFTKKIKED
jgi:curli biogenesis system outer membrane secretion channel CsgG